MPSTLILCVMINNPIQTIKCFTLCLCLHFLGLLGMIDIIAVEWHDAMAADEINHAAAGGPQMHRMDDSRHENQNAAMELGTATSSYYLS